MTSRMSTYRIIPVLMLTVALGTASAQTKIVPPPNKYPPSEDVKAGQEAAAQVMKELPMLNDAATEEYVQGSASGSWRQSRLSFNIRSSTTRSAW